MKDLMDIRKDIDCIDKEILRLYEKRLPLACDVANYKIADHKHVCAKEREAQKIAALTCDCKDSFTRQGVEELFQQIMLIQAL